MCVHNSEASFVAALIGFDREEYVYTNHIPKTIFVVQILKGMKI
jgi:hypothetical protein